MFDVNAKRVKSPLNKLLIYLNKFDEESLNNEKLRILLKNIKTNFTKLIYTISYISKFQEDEEFLKKYDSTKIISIQQIEYCFYKISTIWDISYEIANILIFPNQKKVNGKGVDKYTFLNDKFSKYSEDLANLNTEWYEEITKIRNKIVHGGINIMPFYINSEDVEKRICFQAYNLELNDLIKTCDFYTNLYNNNINYADNFFVYYTHVLYSYLFDFFDFILLELTKNKDIDINKDLYLEDNNLDIFQKSYESWLLSDIDIFSEITKKMVVLEKMEGHVLKEFKEEQWNECINKRYKSFPFLMMNHITEGDYKIVDKHD
jgi:hypothetical protein